MAFEPRYNDTGILNNFHWYSENPFYLAGYGMPNCTCYAWGRFWEIGDPRSIGEHKPDGLPTSDGGSWWGDNQRTGNYQSGQTPELGAVICFSDNYGGSGHVAIVEHIDTNTGDLICSNSAWRGTYFFTSNVYASNGYNWSHYTCQGFIYNPYADQPTPPPPEVEKKHKFPWFLYFRKRRLNF